MTTSLTSINNSTTSQDQLTPVPSAHCSIASHTEQVHKKNSAEKIKGSVSLRKIVRGLILVDKRADECHTSPAKRALREHQIRGVYLFLYVCIPTHDVFMGRCMWRSKVNTGCLSVCLPYCDRVSQ